MTRIIYFLVSLLSSFIPAGAAALSLNNIDRRVFVSKQGAILSVGFLATKTKPAFADVSDGNSLPDGAAQFSRILRLKSEIVVSILHSSQSSYGTACNIEHSTLRLQGSQQAISSGKCSEH